MKSYATLMLIVVIGLVAPTHSRAQSHEVQQLLLNVEKLAQFKKILRNMYDGYKVLDKGYTAVKDISQGTFTLHKTFLDGLLEISPVVKRYKKVTDIISFQLRILREHQTALRHFREEGQFTAEEVRYISTVYTNLFSQTLKSLDELWLVLSAGQLRMTDDERLQAVDRLYTTVEGQFSFFKDFTSNTLLLSMQRKSAGADIEMSKRLSGIK